MHHTTANTAMYKRSWSSAHSRLSAWLVPNPCVQQPSGSYGGVKKSSWEMAEQGSSEGNKPAGRGQMLLEPVSDVPGLPLHDHAS